MAQFNVHEAKTNFSQLLEMVERGEEVIVARHGTPVARLVAMQEPPSILGIGVGDPNYLELTDAAATAPLEPADLKLWFGE